MTFKQISPTPGTLDIPDAMTAAVAMTPHRQERTKYCSLAESVCCFAAAICPATHTPLQTIL